MTGKTEQIQEFKADDQQSQIPEPVATAAHANRPADKSNGEAPKQFATKAEAISAAVSALAPFQTQQIADFLAGLGKEKNTRPLDKSGTLDGTVAFKGVQKEDLDDLFAGAELTEDQQLRVTTLFEAAVSVASAQHTAALDEEFETKLTEAVEEIRSDLAERNDAYLDQIADRWLEENKINAEPAIKVQMAETFIESLVKLLGEHRIILPESVDVLADMTARLEEANQKLAAAMETIAEQKDTILGHQISEAFHEATEGLALTQTERLRSLAESIEASSVTEFQSKLNILKEALLENKSSGASNGDALTEEFVGNEDEAKPASPAPQVRGYADAISRHVKS